MTALYVTIGVVLLLIVWAIVSATSRKSEIRSDPVVTPPQQTWEPKEYNLPKVKHWQEATTASVSKNFGKGGPPTGVSTDVGKAIADYDDDFERLKRARPFERRMTPTNPGYEES